MYNRYIPQADGTHLRHSMPDAMPPPAPPPSAEPPCPPPSPEMTGGDAKPGGASKPKPGKVLRPPKPASAPCPPSPPQPAGDFLRNLLPTGLDTGDLLVILLLLLIAGDCRDHRSTALLTLALYLFL